MLKKSFVQINGVNCLLYEPTEIDKNVTIVIYHGWASSIYNQQFLANIFNSHGYTVMIPELIGHDSRGKIDDYHAQGSWERNGWQIVIEMVKESQTFIEKLTEEPWMKDQKMVLYGNSMGGFIASGVFVQNGKPDSLILVNSTGDWRALLETGASKVLAEVVIPDEFDLLNPTRHISEIGDRPILLIHGENDEIVPIATQEGFYTETIEQGCKNVTFNKYWHVNHTVGLSMIEDVVNWLNEKYSLETNNEKKH
ncbi:MAG: prolyl oligopeptidase family protein [Bacillales bacterium]|jgi:alpha-beta hydrolase superfamily lysophospholipase|nr:prolyl oligopeptidase family protein [Bacillales bacterium]